jgi:hypothetical protein
MVLGIDWMRERGERLQPLAAENRYLVITGTVLYKVPARP